MTQDTGARSTPYPGLRPFRSDETHLFFGRDEQRTELMRRLRHSRFLAVVGTSGSGKSSLVRAGLLPGLYGGFMGGAGSRWRVVDTRPGGDPIGRLAEALDARGALRDDEDLDEEGLSFTESTLRRSSRGLVHVVREAHLPEGERVLVLVDQFEEIFRFVDSGHSARAGDDASAFVKLLLEAARQTELPIYVVLTMRSDFLGDCARFRGLPEAINDGQYLVPRLTRDQQREAIEGPAAVFGAAISPALVSQLLNNVGDVPDQLPILQHALMRTWDHCKAIDPHDAVLDLDEYEATGGMTLALSRHAQAVLEGLSEGLDSDAAERRLRIAERLFKCLTELADGNRKIRRLARLKEVASVADAGVEEVASVVEAFRASGNSFLMPPVGEALTPESYIDISHESLIRNWGTLGTWVDEEASSAEQYRRLARRAQLHAEGAEDLLGGQGLAVAEDWLSRQAPTAAWAERYDAAFDLTVAYVDDSRRKLREQEGARRGRRRARRALAGGLVLATMAIVGPWVTGALYDYEFRERIADEEESIGRRLQEGAADRLMATVYGRWGEAVAENLLYHLARSPAPGDVRAVAEGLADPQAGRSDCGLPTDDDCVLAEVYRDLSIAAVDIGPSLANLEEAIEALDDVPTARPDPAALASADSLAQRLRGAHQRLAKGAIERGRTPDAAAGSGERPIFVRALGAALSSLSLRLFEILLVLAVAGPWLGWIAWRWLRTRLAEAPHEGEPHALRLAAAAHTDLGVAVGLGFLFGGAVFFLVEFGVGLSGSFLDTGSVAESSALIASFVVAVGYLLLRDVTPFRFRRSIGKILFALRPLGPDGGPVGVWTSMKRNFLILPAVLLMGVAAVAASEAIYLSQAARDPYGGSLEPSRPVMPGDVPDVLGSATNLGQMEVGGFWEVSQDYSVTTGRLCGGWGSLDPTAIVAVGEAGQALRIHFESETDTRLVVLDPNENWVCNDDDPMPGAGYDPGVYWSQPPEGSYYVWVTTYDLNEASEPVSGTLYATAENPGAVSLSADRSDLLVFGLLLPWFLILILTDKVGNRIAGTTVVDVRSEEAARPRAEPARIRNP